jgi:hypothetical protein
MERSQVKVPSPFAYPTEPHRRRHGPMGYSRYRDYRNWLRDEFTFRCIYCLRRETWLTLSADWGIDHYLPKSDHPEAARDYDNLVYACNCCNRTKAARYLPDPAKVAYAQCVRVNDNGEIHWLTEEGQNLIEALGLDDEDYTVMRRRILEAIEEGRPGGRIHAWLLGFPDNIPDLSQEPKPPGGNKCPNGIRESCFERRKRGELSSYY